MHGQERHHEVSDMCDTQQERITNTNVVWHRSYVGIGYVIGLLLRQLRYLALATPAAVDIGFDSAKYCATILVTRNITRSSRCYS